MAGRLHLNDIGTDFIVTIVDDNVPVDMTGYTTLEYKFVAPSSVSYTRSGEPTLVSSGIMTYTTVDGDLSEIGVWKMQCHVVIPAGEWHTDVVQFTVYPNL